MLSNNTSKNNDSLICSQSCCYSYYTRWCKTKTKCNVIEIVVIYTLYTLTVNKNFFLCIERRVGRLNWPKKRCVPRVSRSPGSGTQFSMELDNIIAVPYFWPPRRIDHAFLLTFIINFIRLFRAWWSVR